MKSKSGFTIVELLVVILVIGVLTAIVTVVYNGIQDRARNAAMLSGMDTVEKALRIYQQKHGNYPDPTELTGGNAGVITFACVQPTSSGWPVKDGLTASQCLVGGTNPPSGYSTILRQALLESISKIPDTSDVTVSSGGDAGRGIMYQYISPGAADILYWIRGDQTCGRGTKLSLAGSSSTLTYCTVSLR